MTRRVQRRVTETPSPVQDQPPPAPPASPASPASNRRAGRAGDRRAYLRLRIKAAHKRVYCVPEQWRCGRCGTGMVRQEGVLDMGALAYVHVCTREPAADIVNRIRTGMTGD